MISYCTVCYRPPLDVILLEDLTRKTTVPYEILLWLNVDDPELEQFIAQKQAQGHPIRIVGKTPENIAMLAFKPLFEQAKFDMVVQMYDDVLFVSNGLAQTCKGIFDRHKKVKQLVADVWQDEWTTGSRPHMSSYTLVDAADGLYNGPVDGWFAVYHRDAVETFIASPFQRHFYLGTHMWYKLQSLGLQGLLCTRIKVFHAEGPIYSYGFGLLDREIKKYRAVGRNDFADGYESAKATLPPQELIEERVLQIKKHIDTFQA